MYHLYDTVEGKKVCDVPFPELGVTIVASLMRVRGTEHCRNRYQLTETPNKNGMAKLVMRPETLFERAQARS